VRHELRRLRALSGLRASLLAAVAAGGFAGCTAPAPRDAVRVGDVETYWVLDAPVGGKTFAAPVVRFTVENISGQQLLAVETTASFRRAGSEDGWGSGYERLTAKRRRIEPGEKVQVTMVSDARYTLEGNARVEEVFANKAFKPVTVKYFVRVGSSGWEEFGSRPVENLVGSSEAREVLQPGK
jgi:hypothetical protein